MLRPCAPLPALGTGEIRARADKASQFARPPAGVARYFNNSPTFWMNLQTRYDLEVAEEEIADKVERDVRPLEVVRAR